MEDLQKRARSTNGGSVILPLQRSLGLLPRIYLQMQVAIDSIALSKKKEREREREGGGSRKRLKR